MDIKFLPLKGKELEEAKALLKEARLKGTTSWDELKKTLDKYRP